ncbi:MAG: hypothetical protein QXM27_01710 [Candidatus Pacearchaeota archaeon]
MRFKISLLLAIAVVILLILVIYFFIFFEENCNEDKFCFLTNLRSCEKAIYKDKEWFYRIEGKYKDSCLVYVKNIALYGVNIEYANAIKGKDMRCYIPLNKAGMWMPHEDLDYCTGQLKEATLDLMVKKMHQYIIQHIGEFNISEIFIS